MSDVIYLSNVRLSFPHIAEPQTRKDPATGVEKISYNADFIMPVDHAGFAQFMKRVGELATINAKKRKSKKALAELKAIYDQAKALLVAAGVIGMGLPALESLRMSLYVVSAIFWLIAVRMVIWYPESARWWAKGIVLLPMGLILLIPAWCGLVPNRDRKRNQDWD